jgi:hypothetical protein
VRNAAASSHMAKRGDRETWPNPASPVGALGRRATAVKLHRLGARYQWPRRPAVEHAVLATERPPPRHKVYTVDRALSDMGVDTAPELSLLPFLFRAAFGKLAPAVVLFSRSSTIPRRESSSFSTAPQTATISGDQREPLEKGQALRPATGHGLAGLVGHGDLAVEHHRAAERGERPQRRVEHARPVDAVAAESLAQKHRSPIISSHGPLWNQTTAVQVWQREPLFMPPSCRSSDRSGNLAQLGRRPTLRY